MWTVISNVKMIIWRSFVTSCFCPWKCYIRQSWDRMPDLEHVEVFSIPRAIPVPITHNKVWQEWEQYVLSSLIVVIEGSGHWPELDSVGGMGAGGSQYLSLGALVGVMWGGWQRSKSSSHNMVLHLKCLIVERVDIGGFGTPVQWWRGN